MRKSIFFVLYVLVLIMVTLVLTACSNLTQQEKEFKKKCEVSGGTFIKCSGSQSDSFIGRIKGSCEPAGSIKCYCPEMKGLVEQNGICVKDEG